MEYIITIKVKDKDNNYGDNLTLENYFGNELVSIARNLDIDFTALSVKVSK